MKILTAEQMRALDRAAIASGVPGHALMERAGQAVADAAVRLARQQPAGEIVVVCGKGNNGGDGFVATRHFVSTRLCRPRAAGRERQGSRGRRPRESRTPFGSRAESSRK